VSGKVKKAVPNWDGRRIANSEIADAARNRRRGFSTAMKKPSGEPDGLLCE